MSDETPRGPEGAPPPSPRELGAAAAIQAAEAEEHDSDPDYPALTERGALHLAKVAIAAADAVDIENRIVRIRSLELGKSRGRRMTTTDQLAAIEARAEAASPGPWDAARGANADGTTYATTYAEKTEFLAVSLNNNRSPLWLVASDEVIPAATGDGPRARANAEFIAHARMDVPALLALVREQQAKLREAQAAAWDEASRAIKATIGGYAEEGVWAFEQAENLNPNPYRAVTVRGGE